MVGKAANSAASSPTPSNLAHGEPVPVIGIGASAGGLAAIEKLLSAIRFPCGKAIVIVQHLDPNRASSLAELLQRVVSVPVQVARQGTLVQPDHIYTIPPGRNMALKGRYLELSKPPERRSARLPIDFFFISLASQLGDRGRGVVLSGMGSDGTVGLRAIQAAGGRTFAQMPETAKFDGMPTSAIQAGVVDAVSTLEDLAVDLLKAAQKRKRAGAAPSRAAAEARVIEGILTSVQRQTGHDFGHYKASIVRRRIERRMDAIKVSGLTGYAKIVDQQTGEADLLAQSFLIGVTDFFRDQDFWEYLRSVTVPALLRDLPKHSMIRAWVAGCATGEEAYSLAILLTEAQDRLPAEERHEIRLFATDLDPDSIDFARKGSYKKSSFKTMPADRLERWFMEDQGQYLVRAKIREQLVFAVHDVAVDPPFTRMDLISCRNLMIYLGSDLQRTLLEKFHYCLNPSGFLLLGSSEAMPLDDRRFGQTHPHFKIFQRLEASLAARFTSPSARSVPLRFRRASSQAPKARDLASVCSQALIDNFSPPAVVVSDDGELLQVLGNVGKYLEPGAAKANLNVHGMARHNIRGALSDAMRVVARGRVSKASRLGIAVEGSRAVPRVTVKRFTVDGPLNSLLMIAFDEAPLAGLPSRGTAKARDYARSLRQLELEVEELRQENSNAGQQLTAANEELQAINEELQSANDELMTTKEETQSMNEELQTINGELQSKLSTFTVVNNDLRNLLENTDIATIFLDQDLRIRRFTRHLCRLVPSIRTFVGRSVVALQSELIYDDMFADVTQVLSTLVITEREIEASEDRVFLVRIIPYRTTDNVIDGVFITYADISASKSLRRQPLGISRPGCSVV